MTAQHYPIVIKVISLCGKSVSKRIICNRSRRWAKTLRCTEFRQNITKIVVYRLTLSDRQDGHTDRQT